MPTWLRCPYSSATWQCASASQPRRAAALSRVQWKRVSSFSAQPGSAPSAQRRSRHALWRTTAARGRGAWPCKGPRCAGEQPRAACLFVPSAPSSVAHRNAAACAGDAKRAAWPGWKQASAGGSAHSSHSATPATSAGRVAVRSAPPPRRPARSLQAQSGATYKSWRDCVSAKERSAAAAVAHQAPGQQLEVVGEPRPVL
jgi:hypothetical protein